MLQVNELPIPLGMQRRIRLFFVMLFDLLFGAIVVFGLLHVSLLTYGVRMGYGQLHIVYSARPVEEVLKDTAVSDSIKNKLQLIQEIRRFAFDELGLKENKNYTSFYDQHKKPLIYVVTACEPYALKAYRWEYSFLGAMPYKGYFTKLDAQVEKIRLKKLGYDVELGGAAGWSTLGWFNDPILSQMLNRNEGDLAELIIHELTHGTLFVKDNAEFNENLASFVGYKGAIAFLNKRYGENSKQLKMYLDGRRDDDATEKFMLTQAVYLDSVYKSFPSNLKLEEKQQRKANAFQVIRQRATADTLLKKWLPLFFAKRLNDRGNTIFMQYLRYGSQQHDFETEFAKFGEVKKYLDFLKKKYS